MTFKLFFILYRITLSFNAQHKHINGYPYFKSQDASRQVNDIENVNAFNVR